MQKLILPSTDETDKLYIDIVKTIVAKHCSTEIYQHKKDKNIFLFKGTKADRDKIQKEIDAHFESINKKLKNTGVGQAATSAN